MTRPSSPTPPGSRGGLQLATPAPAGFIGRYQILEKIGEGGMGSLFLARDPAIDRLVAIKLLRRGVDTAPLRERFAREARAAGRLRHPHIVTIFDVGEHDGDPFIAMEFLAGETLAELIRDGARLSLSRRLKLIEEVCDGLAYAHRAGLVHRDVKPANLMVDADGVLKILDFGIVRVSDSGITKAGALVGTVNYMSPEQVIGAAVDHRSDIFAVGLVAYELISGRQAFPGTMKDGLLNRILGVATEPLANVVHGLDPEAAAIVDQALRKEPADRYQDLVRMRNDLSRARIRLEREEERAAAEAVADAGETAVISEHETAVFPPPKSSAHEVVQDAERAFADGNFRAALTLAGRSAAINPHDRSASGIVARAEAALLDRGRSLQAGTSGTPVPVPPSQAPQPASSGTAAPAGAPLTLWVAVAVATASLAVAVFALWSKNDGVPQTAATPPVASAPETRSPATAPAAPPAPAGVRPEPAPLSPASVDASPAATGTSVPDAAGDGRGTASPGRRSEPERRSPAPPKASTSPPLPAPPAVEPAPPARPPVLRAGVDMSAPRQTNRVDLVYPPDALAAGISGVVDLELTIGTDGRVSEARVVRSVRGLDDAAVRYVQQWEFAPPRRNGEAVVLIYPVSVPFRLPDTARPPAPTPGGTGPRPAPSAPAPPPPAPAAADPTPSRGVPAVDAREEIGAVLRRYKAAWEALDVAALARVQALSSSDEEVVRRTMTGANSYRLDLSVQSVTVDPSGRTAVARVTIVRGYSPKIGRPVPPQQSTSDMRLEKRAEAWVITSIR